ncbi:MAG: DUF1499 domain-containing protein [Microcoleaceae cyanobacterium]
MFTKVKLRYRAVMMAIFGLILIGSWGIATPAFAQPSQPKAIATLLSFPGTAPSNLGFQDERLAPCPSSPNCVSSQSTDDPTHEIAALTYEQSASEALDKLKMVLETFDNARIVTADDHYLYAEFTIPIFGFVDDVEFYIDEAKGVIQVRSASRLGDSDLGVNRRRVETIRTLFNS